MLRFRKIWMFVAILVMILVLITSFFKPDFVTVVPDENQLNRRDSELHLEHKQGSDSSSSTALPKSNDTLKNKD